MWGMVGQQLKPARSSLSPGQPGKTAGEETLFCQAMMWLGWFMPLGFTS